VRHVARIKEMTNAYKFLVGKLEGKRPLGRPREKREIILQLILEKQWAKVWVGFIWLRIGTSGGLLCTR